MTNIVKLLVTTIISLNFYVSSLSANTEQHLSQHGVSMQVARDFIMNNYQNDLALVYNTCKTYGVNNDMIAELLQNDIPGLTAEGVSGFFILSGFDGSALGFNEVITLEWSTKEGTEYEGNTIIQGESSGEYFFTVNKKTGEKSRAERSSDNNKFYKIATKVEPLTFNDNSSIRFITYDWVPNLSDNDVQTLGFSSNNAYLQALIKIEKNHISTWIGIGEDNTSNYVVLTSSSLQNRSDENNNTNQTFDLIIERLSNNSYEITVENETTGEKFYETLTIPDEYSITTSMETNKAVGIRGEIKDDNSTYPASEGQVTFKSSAFEVE